MNNKVLTLLGFASKVGRLSFGANETLNSVKSRKAKTVVTACDISAKSLKEISFFGEKENIPVLTLKGIDIENLSKAIGRRCGMVAVNDIGFAEALKEEILNDQ